MLVFTLQNILSLSSECKNPLCITPVHILATAKTMKKKNKNFKEGQKAGEVVLHH